MKANCYWPCQDCGLRNLTQVDTVSPHVQLVCSKCGKPQYVRLTLENTLLDLRDCGEHLWDEDLSENEERSRRRLKKLILELAEEIKDNDGEEAQP